MNKKRLLAVVILVDGLILLLMAFATAVSSQAAYTPLPSTLSGTVSDANGVVADAIVQIQGTPIQTLSGADGSFTFTGVKSVTPIVISAWQDGHHVGWATVDPSAADWKGGTGITITVQLLPTTDDSKYTWFTKDGITGSAACALCHREYSEWKADAHSQAATNIRFLTVYTGTNAAGEKGQMTKWGLTGALPPDPSKPYYGPGMLLDYPDRAGNCASCHTPLVSTSPNNQNCAWSGCHMAITIANSNGVIAAAAIPTSAHGVSADGISCEFCHKTGDVYVDPQTRLPNPAMPGILSMKLYRPGEGVEQVFFGTLLDVNVPDSYLPLLTQSQFCAGCHYGIAGGVVSNTGVTGGTLIYDSYGEWLDSPYSNPITGKSCQDCHMPVSNAHFSVYPDKGGLVRSYVQYHDHTMPGASDANLLQNAVTMTSTSERAGDQLQVDVRIVNDQTGHSVPTDAPDRSMILVVEALGADGKPLALTDGPVNPEYSGDLGGLPGKTFAKVLKDDWTGEMPTIAFWRPVTLDSDTRLAALATDTTHYRFALPSGEAATISVRLIYRRAFAGLSQQKGWNDPDILMEHETLQVSPN